MAPTSRFVTLALSALVLATTAADAGPFKRKKSRDELAEKRARIDAMASATLKRLAAANPKDKAVLDGARGYAVFDNTKVALGFSGGGGRGVTVDSATGKRTYMRMATVGVGLGLGAQSYQVVFAFENEKALRRFIEEGWEADASAQAAAGRDGVNAESQFRDGLAVWQLTEKGLMARADLAGTKYWQHHQLN